MPNGSAHSAAENHDRYRVLFQQAVNGVLLLTAVEDGDDFLIADVNQTAIRITNGAAAAAVGRRLSAFAQEPALDRLLQGLRRVAREGVPLRLGPVEHASHLVNGWWETTLFALPQGELAVILADVSHLREVEAAKEAANQRLRALVEFLPDPTFATDLDGRVTLWNRAMARMTGVPQEQALGQGDRFYSLPFYGQRRPLLVDLVLGDEQHVATDVSYEGLRRDHDGDRDGYWATVYAPSVYDGQGAWLALKAAPLYDQQGTLMGAIETIRDVSERYQQLQLLQQEREHLSVTLASIGDGVIAVDRQGQVTMLNPVAQELTGWRQVDALGLPLPQVFHIINEYTRQAAANPVPTVLARGKTVGLANHTALIDRAGHERSIADSAAPIRSADGEILGAVLVFRDVTDERRRADQLAASEQRLRHITDNLRDLVCETDERGRLHYVSQSSKQLLGYEPEELVGRSLLDLLEPIDRTAAASLFGTAAADQAVNRLELRWRRRDGQTIWVEVVGNAMRGQDEHDQSRRFLLAVREITERRQLQERLLHLSQRDSLTGLYNRRYFEQEMARLDERRATQVGMLFCDVDGLKLVNDTLGHDAGDQLLLAITGIINAVTQPDQIAARVGGDEFAILLCPATAEQVGQLGQAVRQAVDRYNRTDPLMPLSVSIGLSSSSDSYQEMRSLFKEADDGMYREKLHQRQSIRSALVQTLMKALEARDFITEGHAARLQDMVVALGEAWGLPQRDLGDLRLLAQFHDIGKVGIPDHILFKPEPLTPEERADMQRHSEIGHRIAQSAPDLVTIADLILKHHEWWNGTGYPLGLRGWEIPLPCRMLAIADAFDAMTNDRPYRRALAPEAALRELERFSGVQFDPELVPLFVRLAREGRFQ